MPRDLEDIFLQEAKKMFRNVDADKDVTHVPLPKECENWFVSEKEVRKVVNIPKQSGLIYTGYKTVTFDDVETVYKDEEIFIDPVTKEDIENFYKSSFIPMLVDYKITRGDFTDANGNMIPDYDIYAKSELKRNIMSNPDSISNIKDTAQYDGTMYQVFINNFLSAYTKNADVGNAFGEYNRLYNCLMDTLKKKTNNFTDKFDAELFLDELNNFCASNPIKKKNKAGRKRVKREREVPVKKIVDFSRFNEQLVVVEKQYLGRRYDSVTNDFVRDNAGNPVRDVKAPGKTITFSTPHKLRIPLDCNNSKEFGYLDFEDTPEGRRYIYYVPKDFCPAVTQIALVLSNKDSKSFWSTTYQTWDFGKMSLKVVVYNPGYVVFSKDSTSTKVLYTTVGESPEEIFDNDIKEKVEVIENFWINKNVMGDPDLFESYYTGANMIRVKEKEDTIEFDGVSETGHKVEPLFDDDNDDDAFNMSSDDSTSDDDFDFDFEF